MRCLPQNYLDPLIWLLAHEIRHQSTQQFQAITQIQAKHRWCLTGTPIQNSLDDLGALVRFLRVQFLEQPSAFRKNISKPVERGEPEGIFKLRGLLRAICLRRTNDILHLPQPKEKEYILDLSAEEDNEYRAIADCYREDVDRAVSSLNTTAAYNGILQAILRLRLLCNHGTYQGSSQKANSTSSPEQDEVLALLQQSDNAICAYCSCEVVSLGAQGRKSTGYGHLTTCGHLVCADCFPQFEIELKDKMSVGTETCPICHECVKKGTNLTRGKKRKRQNSLKKHVLDESSFGSNAGLSTKLSALLEDIMAHINSDKRYFRSSISKVA